VGYARAATFNGKSGDPSGIHRADIGAIERGERNVTLRTMRTLADTLVVRIADLVKGL
jgi:hypothetical protein